MVGGEPQAVESALGSLSSEEGNPQIGQCLAVAQICALRLRYIRCISVYLYHAYLLLFSHIRRDHN